MEIMDKKMKSKVSRNVKKGRIFCATCRNIFDAHSDHEHVHYGNKIGKGALIECTSCYKTFDSKYSNHN